MDPFYDEQGSKNPLGLPMPPVCPEAIKYWEVFPSVASVGSIAVRQAKPNYTIDGGQPAITPQESLGWLGRQIRSREGYSTIQILLIVGIALIGVLYLAYLMYRCNKGGYSSSAGSSVPLIINAPLSTGAPGGYPARRIFRGMPQ